VDVGVKKRKKKREKKSVHQSSRKRKREIHPKSSPALKMHHLL